jgi:DNA-binding NarL/FixJ family response regulator
MRVIIADHNPAALWGLKTVLDEEPNIEVVGEARDAGELQVMAQRAAAQLLLLDNQLPGLPIEALIAAVQTLVPRPIVVLMSKNPEDSRLMLKAGADAFVSKGDPPDWLLSTLRQYASQMKGNPR